MDSPILYIIAGCNGAGKTTASFTVLPDVLDCEEFVNADEIAKGLSPFHPEEVVIQAGRLMMERISSLVESKRTFAIETTLATRSYLRLVERAKRQGFQVRLLFFWLESPAMAKLRVAKRVSEGGHDIPSNVIERRYWLGLYNLFVLFMPLVDYWWLYDNNSESRLIADSYSVVDYEKFHKIKCSCLNKK